MIAIANKECVNVYVYVWGFAQCLVIEQKVVFKILTIFIVSVIYVCAEYDSYSYK